MAELIEDIIIIEDKEAAAFTDVSAETPLNAAADLSSDSDAKKKKIIIISASAIALILVIVIVLLLVFKKSPDENLLSMNTIEEKLDQNNTVPIEPSQLENMIAKANYLYSNGSKNEALFLYEKIALYSEAISQYNLGVAQLKDKQYEQALDTFSKAIQNDEKRCVSAINAAVCSLHLQNPEKFRYYIDLAYAYLPFEQDSPLYSYYYALINYYNQNYLEALAALKNTTSNEYPNTQKHLLAKINALFGNDYEAIETMEQDFDYLDDFSIGLLYARIGDYPLAISHFKESIVKNIEPVKSQLAQGLVKLKAGKISSGGQDIKNAVDMFPEEAYLHYPIKVRLKEALFEPEKAQVHYREKIENSKSIIYQKLFYFSPYKVFNANQTISYIRKGTANIFIDNMGEAKEYLQKSASSSNVNYGIAKAIKKALAFKIREANEELQELLKIQPKHSILHYNLALTYTQLGDMVKANEHFLRSYHLDAKNYLSGIFAIMTSQLIGKDSTKLASIVKDSVMNETQNEEIDLYINLLHISDNNMISAIEWLDRNYEQQPLYLAMDVIIGLGINKVDKAQSSADKLSLLLPSDILPHMIYIDAHFGDLKPKEYASKSLNYLKEQKFHFDDLHFGPYITRYLYIQQHLFTGKLYFLREELKKTLASTDANTQEITSALALASLYDKAYEESFTLYNYLIDEQKVRDALTLFLGAVASTAAGHHENAIALLELSKMKDTNFVESRYALGLLYLQ
ncbi:MAG: tetratricopeptide repeat protein, partial [Sulfurimonas sp.]|nr:tetratricopeptide repeat protein [Sulfurimonas sp.]